MHLCSEGGVYGHPPVANLVTEPFDHDRAVVGDVPGGFTLFVQIGEQVVRGPGIQAGCSHSGPRLVGAEPAELANELPHGAAELGWPAKRVALPERQLAGLAGRRGDQHLVVGDVLDPPRRCAQGEHVADPRLVDHLLVELADTTPGALAGGEEYGIQTTVRDGAPLGAGSRLAPGRPLSVRVTLTQTRRDRSSANSSLG